jgi:hypothetical protein
MNSTSYTYTRSRGTSARLFERKQESSTLRRKAKFGGLEMTRTATYTAAMRG